MVEPVQGGTLQPGQCPRAGCSQVGQPQEFARLGAGSQFVGQGPVGGQEQSDAGAEDHTEDQQAGHVARQQHQQHPRRRHQAGSVQHAFGSDAIRKPAADQHQHHQGQGQGGQQVAGLLGRVGHPQHILQVILGEGLHAVNAQQEQPALGDQPPVPAVGVEVDLEDFFAQAAEGLEFNLARSRR